MPTLSDPVELLVDRSVYHLYMSGRHPKPFLSASARDRIDNAAYELFSRHGVRAVGVDAIVARSGVAKKTLYLHYPSKEKLVLAFLRRREELWTRAWLQEGVERRAGAPAERLLAVFDVFDRWFRRSDFEGCAFVKCCSSTMIPRTRFVNRLKVISERCVISLGN